MNSISFHPDAAQEANDAVDYYGEIQSGLGDDFRVELNAALDRLQRNPQLYSVESGSVRVCSMHRFPYTVYLAVLADRIWVVAVGHQSRRPGYWGQRSVDSP